MLGPKRQFQQHLLNWYDQNRRALPWRSPIGTLPNPYHVLLSEFMLQQTQVATVIPYYLRFLKKFPTIKHLAASREQTVLKLWEGLGYYSRARRLRAAAQQIQNNFNGQVPNTPERLLSLPGIGRYTAGAIASLAYDQPAPLLDGNVARVLSRLYAAPCPTTDELWTTAARLLPTNRPGDHNSALMELGATICTPRNPNCPNCPVQQHCQAFAANQQNQIPTPKPKPSRPQIQRTILCLHDNDLWLIEKRPPTGRWPNLWQFPTFDSAQLPEQFIPILKNARPLITLHHALTHRQYHFQALLAPALQSTLPGRWLSLPQLSKLPMPKPHVKLRNLLQSLAEKSQKPR